MDWFHILATLFFLAVLFGSIAVILITLNSEKNQ